MLKAACRALKPGHGNELGEACKAISGKDNNSDDQDVYLPLVTDGNSNATGGAVVTYMGLDPLAVEAELVTGIHRNTTDILAVAMPAPVMLEIPMPSANLEPGQAILINGPDGPIRVRLPADAYPGQMLRCKIAPRPEYRIGVPPGVSGGSVIKFNSQEGAQVAVSVPPGLQTGETFDVTPPALMVRIPEQAKPGDWVYFKHKKQLEPGKRLKSKSNIVPDTDYYRARVPQGCMPYDFFAALFPRPEGPEGI